MRTLGIDASRANVRERTGTERYAFELIRGLMRVVPADVRVLLYTREVLLPDLMGGMPSNWESRVLNWPPRRLWTQARLSWEMFRRPPDALFVPVHVLPLLLPRRTAVTLHDVAFATEPEAYGAFENWYQRFAVTFALGHADRVFTVSEFSKSELVKKFHAREKKVTVTPLAADRDEYRAPPGPVTDTVLERYGITKPYFLFVGRLERKKNLDGILRAFVGLRASKPEVSLVLVGKPGYGYERIVHEVPVHDGVIRPGFVAQADIAALYAGATALVFPSRYEGFGMPVLEAFAAGTPVITSHSTALPEVAGDAALYVDPDIPEEISRAMRKLLMDPDAAEVQIARGTARLAEFTWARTAELTWETLRELLEKPSLK